MNEIKLKDLQCLDLQERELKRHVLHQPNKQEH